MTAEKPRIVLLSAFLSPYRSGAEAMVEEVSGRLGDRYDITIITSRLSRSLPKHASLTGVRVLRVGIGFPFDKWLFPFLAPLAARKVRPEVIHAVLETFAGLALVFCALVVPAAKRLLTCQSTNRRLLLGLMHRRSHRVSVISSVLKERAVSYGRTDAVLIPNGVDLSAVQRACAASPKVPGRTLFVGRLRAMKGVDTLLRAFALVPHEHARLLIAGDGEERRTLEKLAGTLSLADRVTFLGRRSHEEVLKEYAQAELFCGLSRSEALGNVFLEAQAAGCAVIATNVGGIPDIVEDGVTGILVSPDDPEAAAEAIKLLLSDSEKRNALAREGEAHARTFDWNDIAPQYAMLYEKLLNRTAGASA